MVKLLKINNDRVPCLLSKATLIGAVDLLLSLPLLSLLLPSLLFLPLLSLSLSSHCVLRPPLPLPPIKASTQSPQSSPATLLSYIYTAAKLCLHCPLHPPLPRCHHPPPPLLNANFTIVTSPPQFNAVKHCHPIECPCLLPQSYITTIERCRRQTTTPAMNTCHIQTLMHATTTPPEIVVPLSPRPLTWMALFRDDVSRPLSSSVVIAPHPHHPPTAFQCHLQPLLIVCQCQFWHL